MDRHLQRHILPVGRRQTSRQVTHQGRHHSGRVRHRCPRRPTTSNYEEGGEEVRPPDLVHWGGGGGGGGRCACVSVRVCEVCALPCVMRTGVSIRLPLHILYSVVNKISIRLPGLEVCH